MAFKIWTSMPAPVNTTTTAQISSATLTPDRQWKVTQAQENDQIQLQLEIGQPQGDVASEFPNLDQQSSAIVGDARCTLTMTNVFGFTSVRDTTTADFLMDGQGVSIANATSYPSGGNLYSITDDGPTALPSTEPVLSQVIRVRVGIALGSNNGANVQNYVIYLRMEIDASGRISCALEADPTSLISSVGEGK